jgi:hypothetical protein
VIEDEERLSRAHGEAAIGIECPACGAPAGYPCNAPVEGFAAAEVCGDRADAAAHPPGKPRYPFVPHHRGELYWLTDGYGYGTVVSPLRWWWRRLVVALQRSSSAAPSDGNDPPSATASAPKDRP